MIAQMLRTGETRATENGTGNPLPQIGHIAMLARMHAPHALKTLVTISKDERAPHAARVSASQAILDRAYGKAPTLNTSDPTM